jgi:FlaG protein
MNGSDLSTAAIPEPVPLPGTGGPVRPSGAARESATTNDPNPLDRRPDVEIAIADTMVRVHAMFHVDPKTNTVHVSVVDEHGKVVRLIPPESVSEMLAAMAAYPTRI